MHPSTTQDRVTSAECLCHLSEVVLSGAARERVASVARVKDMSTSYELWDRFSGNLILDFADQERALDFVRQQVTGLDDTEARQELHRMSMVRVVEGRFEVLAEADALLVLLK